MGELEKKNYCIKYFYFTVGFSQRSGTYYFIGLQPNKYWTKVQLKREPTFPSAACLPAGRKLTAIDTNPNPPSRPHPLTPSRQTDNQVVMKIHNIAAFLF